MSEVEGIPNPLAVWKREHGFDPAEHPDTKAEWLLFGRVIELEAGLDRIAEQLKQWRKELRAHG